YSLDRGCAGQWGIEITGGEDLRCKAEVGHRRRIAVAEPARLALLREMRFKCFDGLQCPMLQPPVARSFVFMHLALEVGADTRHDQRMPIARDDHREAANARPPASILWKQRRFRVRFLQVFDDGE